MRIHRHGSTRVTLTHAAACLSLAACTPHKLATPSPSLSPSAVLEVTNRSIWDMDIYVRRDGERERLGLAPSGATTHFYLSPAQVAGASPIRFEAAPFAGGGGHLVASDPTVVAPNDTIGLDIPPP